MNAGIDGTAYTQGDYVYVIAFRLTVIGHVESVADAMTDRDHDLELRVITDGEPFYAYTNDETIHVL